MQKVTSFHVMAAGWHALEKGKTIATTSSLQGSLFLWTLVYLLQPSCSVLYISLSATVRRTCGMMCRLYFLRILGCSRSVRTALPKPQCLILDFLHGSLDVRFCKGTRGAVDVHWARSQTSVGRWMFRR